MYSIGTLASSGAAARIASRETSVKEGRARLRGSWTLGELIGDWWPWMCMLNWGGWEATWNIFNVE